MWNSTDWKKYGFLELYKYDVIQVSYCAGWSTIQNKKYLKDPLIGGIYSVYETREMISGFVPSQL